MSAAGIIITYQCLIQDYPVEASIVSMLDIVDTVYVNDGKSSDGTLDILYKIQSKYGKDRLVVIEKQWVHDRQFWTRERNYILDNYVKEDWVLSLDADEVLHEEELPELADIMRNSEVNSVSFNVTHFYGTPDYIITGPVWYTRHTQLWRISTGIRWVHRPGGCADDILWPDMALAHFSRYTPTNATLYHYGHCRSPRAMGLKMRRADDLYQNSTSYINGSLAEETSWKYDLNRDGVLSFNGCHPKYVCDWVAQHRNQELEFIV